ncbi:MAG TPA: MBL fold metallo-hydrolase [Methylomirabilota bacterium]|nr:MBL fold metallo-hydrolase [Methylomirabilota bacterium]
MRVRFWGTRGSIAKPGPATVRFGGNTSCVEVRSASGTLLVLDCGTGAYGLGHALVADRTMPYRGHMLITHTHWDHIQGFPFFAPLFLPGDEWDVYAPRGLRESLRETLAGQMQYTYFPVSLEQFAARVRYHDLVEGVFTVGDVRVTARYLNHPALTLGYRLEADGVSIVYATDHEPHSRALADGDTGPLAGEDRRHAEFLAGADLVIHDSQYTAAEYATKVGWGHSTIESVVSVSRAARARRLALYHHDPMRDDQQIGDLAEAAQQQAGSGLEVFAAAEGMVVDMTPSARPQAAVATAPVAARTSVPDEMLDQTVLVALDQPELRERLMEAVMADGFKLTTAADSDAVLKPAPAAPASLLMLGRRLAGRDSLELVRAVRRGVDAYDKDVPIVLVAASEAEADRAAGAEAGITDWLVAPFSMLYARTRVRAWALRQACRWIAAPAPADETERLRALHARGILDTPAEERFDRITRLARRLLDVPAAMVTMIDAERQWFKSKVGFETTQTSRDVAFCAYTIQQEEMFVVPDALTDPRFAESPAVVDGPRLRFYAGRPVHIDGRRVGALCVMDNRPRQLDDDDKRALEDLAALVDKELQ